MEGVFIMSCVCSCNLQGCEHHYMAMAIGHVYEQVCNHWNDHCNIFFIMVCLWAAHSLCIM